MKRLALLLLIAAPIFAQPALINQTLLYPVIGPSTVASLPTTGIKVGALAVATDAMTAGSCTVNGGSAIALCRWSGVVWESLGGAGGGGGTPGGSTTQIQYNSSGSFAGTTGMIYNSGTNTATIANLVAGTTLNAPSGTWIGGYTDLLSIAAPATPAAGSGRAYVDSTSKNIAVKDDAGVVKHGVQTKAPVANSFATGISDAGVVSVAQPTPADLAVGTLATAMTVGATGSIGPTSASLGIVSANYLNATPLHTLATGPLANTTTTGVPRAATATDMSIPLFCMDAGSTDTYACTLAPAITSYVTGTHYRFRAATVNTGAATINFNALGAKDIKKMVGATVSDPATNDIRAGQWVDLVYDGTYMVIQSLLGNPPSAVADSVTGAINLTTANRIVTVSAPGAVTEQTGITATGGVITATGFVGAVTGNASTATALAANPAACTNQVVTDMAANGTLTCASVVEDMVTLADVTTGNVSTSVHGFQPKIQIHATDDPTAACVVGQKYMNYATPSLWECVQTGAATTAWKLVLSSSGTGAGSIEFPVDGAMSVGTAGTVKIGAHTGNVLGVSLNGGSVKTAMMTDTAVADAQLDAKHKAWQIHYKLWGTGTGNLLVATDDELSVWRNDLSARTITQVVCETDDDAPTLMLQKDDGSPADMFASAMTCNSTPSGTNGTDGILTSFVSGENALATGVRLDHLLVSIAGGAGHWVAVTISGTID